MTKHRETGDPDVEKMEVTEKMIDAGFKRFRAWEVSEEPSVRNFVKSLFQVMMDVRQDCHR